ncbi:Transcriptional activator protein Anr [Pedobacter sp. Bi27]|uniref:Crp/Fnr family transcriptional regulator n=1 Tax=unclassified Pedobacter TaxID=2628915 RepID=UPI001DD6D503|nr:MULTISPECIES: Crp/Fnr family transcriptional regulator [unclassified Pedobacter]CAH0167516.1 Transcriptional activator protein Anr [Pedobacter sp. Bi126]CAH0168134.1 Transcriptional activator protein Anr [Pedobacter sp. Bi27]
MYFCAKQDYPMKECNNVCDVKSCYLCSRVMVDWLPAVSQKKKNFQLKKGEQLFTETEPVGGIFFVFSGTIKVHKKWDNEKELIIRFARPGDVIGHLGLGKNPIYPVSATALEQATVCFIDLEFFRSSLKVNPDLTYQLMDFFASELQESHERMRNLAHMSVKGRVSNALLSLQSQFGVDNNGAINLDISRQDIASYSGTTYETLFKIFTEFINAGKISAQGKRIEILDASYLREIVLDDNKKN